MSDLRDIEREVMLALNDLIQESMAEHTLASINLIAELEEKCPGYGQEIFDFNRRGANVIVKINRVYYVNPCATFDDNGRLRIEVDAALCLETPRPGRAKITLDTDIDFVSIEPHMLKHWSEAGSCYDKLPAYLTRILDDLIELRLTA